MTQKEIRHILDSESGMILLERKSDLTFWETIFSQIPIISIPYFLLRKKMDFLILTESRIILIRRNRILKERQLTGNEVIDYNGIKTVIEILNQNKVSDFSLQGLRVTYENSQAIKQNLIEFKNKR